MNTEHDDLDQLTMYPPDMLAEHLDGYDLHGIRALLKHCEAEHARFLHMAAGVKALEGQIRAHLRATADHGEPVDAEPIDDDGVSGPTGKWSCIHHSDGWATFDTENDYKQHMMDAHPFQQVAETHGQGRNLDRTRATFVDMLITLDPRTHPPLDLDDAQINWDNLTIPRTGTGEHGTWSVPIPPDLREYGSWLVQRTGNPDHDLPHPF